ncbi:unnamed protein product [Moneuplotes crassus]|uniref:Uncharacterized protein n=1 Tax=Euplotes crassus TaxID=5936 RepID=A0AAD1U5Y6_EUPCR|nr:unnamed protein product [Moneuplotes crassus]
MTYTPSQPSLSPLTSFCITKIHSWLKKLTGLPSSYEFTLKNETGFELNFKTKSLRDKAVTQICCALYCCSLEDLKQEIKQAKEESKDKWIDESSYVDCGPVASEKESDKHFVVNNVLDQSYVGSGKRSSVAWSDMASSFLCSPKPERVENIPKPQSGLGMKPPTQERIQEVPQKNLMTTPNNKLETPERPQSLHREPVHSRFEKLDLVNYREKRSEHLQKHSSRIRNNMSGKNLLSELRKLDLKKNPNSLADPHLEENKINIKTINANQKMFKTACKNQKSIERKPEVQKNALKTELRPKASHKDLNMNSSFGRPSNPKPYDKTPVTKSSGKLMYLNTNYEDVITKAKKLEEKRKALEKSWRNQTNNTKTPSEKESLHPKNSTLHGSRNVRAGQHKEMISNSSTKDLKKSRNVTERGTIQSYIRNANAKIKIQKNANKSTARLYNDYSSSIDIKDPVRTQGLRQSLNSTIDLHKFDKKESRMSRLGRKCKRLSEEHKNFTIDMQNLKERKNYQDECSWQTPKKLNKANALRMYGNLQPVPERSSNDDHIQYILGKHKFKDGYQGPQRLWDFVENSDKKPSTTRTHASKFGHYLS